MRDITNRLRNVRICHCTEAHPDISEEKLAEVADEIDRLRARIKQLEADLRGQVAAKHQLGLIASQYRDELLQETTQ